MSESTGAPAATPVAAPAPAPVITADAAPPPPRPRGRPPKAANTNAAPAAAPAPGGQLGARSPGQAPREGISVSEAARLLGQQRRGGQEAPAPAAGAPERRPAARDVAAQANDNRPVSNDNAATTPQPAPASALERALGVPPGGAAPEAAPAADSPGLEIEGQRYSTAQIREAVLKAQDYTQKMQGVAEARQQVQAQQAALATVLPYIQPELARLAEVVQQAPQKPDAAMLETDPHGYLRARAAYEQAMEEQQRLGSLTTLQQQAQARVMEQAVAQANEQLTREIEGWADPQQRGQLQAEIREWATTKGGFSPAELSNLVSPHHLKTMMKAAMYDKMVAGAKSAPPPPRLQAPVRGAPPPAPLSERIQQATQAFTEKPTFRSGAALLAARRGLNGR